MAGFEGRCPECGRIHRSKRKGDIATCDCWLQCPICGAEMQPYSPDLAPGLYALEGKRDLTIVKTCTLHSPPFFSTRKPVEVVCL